MSQSMLSLCAGILLAIVCLPAQADIPIGLAGPLTGADASFGEQLRRGARMAVADINAAGGVLGQKLDLIEGDDQCDPKQAVAVANQTGSQGREGRHRAISVPAVPSRPPTSMPRRTSSRSRRDRPIPC